MLDNQSLKAVCLALRLCSNSVHRKHVAREATVQLSHHSMRLVLRDSILDIAEVRSKTNMFLVWFLLFGIIKATRFSSLKFSSMSGTQGRLQAGYLRSPN